MCNAASEAVTFVCKYAAVIYSNTDCRELCVDVMIALLEYRGVVDASASGWRQDRNAFMNTEQIMDATQC